jgi:hypothetical protein
VEISVAHPSTQARDKSGENVGCPTFVVRRVFRTFAVAPRGSLISLIFVTEGDRAVLPVFGIVLVLWACFGQPRFLYFTCLWLCSISSTSSPRCLRFSGEAVRAATVAAAAKPALVQSDPSQLPLAALVGVRFRCTGLRTVAACGLQLRVRLVLIGLAGVGAAALFLRVVPHTSQATYIGFAFKNVHAVQAHCIALASLPVVSNQLTLRCPQLLFLTYGLQHVYHLSTPGLRAFVKLEHPVGQACTSSPARGSHVEAPERNVRSDYCVQRTST